MELLVTILVISIAIFGVLIANGYSVKLPSKRKPTARPIITNGSVKEPSETLIYNNKGELTRHKKKPLHKKII